MKNNTTTNVNVILVARVSDVEQRKALPAQQKRLLEYAERKHWKENRDFIYIEFDETAFKENRKTFNQLVIEPLQEAKSKQIVVFDKIDRFSRDSTSSERQALTKLFRQGKLEMHFPSDNLFIHSDSPAADLFRLDIGVALAGYYSSAIRDNVKRRFEELLSNGVWVHRAPVGYKNVHLQNPRTLKAEKDIAVDEDRAHYIIQAFELRALGMPYSQIAKELLSAGYTSHKTGKAQLAMSDIEKIINNKFYYGVMTHKGKDYPHKYRPLIDRTLYNQCQMIKDKRKEMKTKWDSLDFNLKDVVTCGVCGRAVSPFRAKQWVYLNCANPKCKNPNTAESLVMGSIEAVIQKIQIPNDLIEKVVEQLKYKHDDQQMYYMQSITKLRHEHDDIDKRLDHFFDMLVSGRLTPEKHDKVVNTLSERQEAINEQVRILTSGNKDFQITASYLLDLANRAEELYKVADEGQRSKLIGFLLSNLKLNDKKLSFTVNYPFNLTIEEKEKAPEGAKTPVWCG